MQWIAEEVANNIVIEAEATLFTRLLLSIIRSDHVEFLVGHSHCRACRSSHKIRSNIIKHGVVKLDRNM